MFSHLPLSLTAWEWLENSQLPPIYACPKIELQVDQKIYLSEFLNANYWNQLRKRAKSREVRASKNQHKRVNCVVCELYFNKVIKKKKKNVVPNVSEAQTQREISERSRERESLWDCMKPCCGLAMLATPGNLLELQNLDSLSLWIYSMKTCILTRSSNGLSAY